MFLYIDQLRFTSGAMIFKNFQILGHPKVHPLERLHTPGELFIPINGILTQTH